MPRFPPEKKGPFLKRRPKGDDARSSYLLGIPRLEVGVFSPDKIPSSLGIATRPIPQRDPSTHSTGRPSTPFQNRPANLQSMHPHLSDAPWQGTEKKTLPPIKQNTLDIQVNIS